MLQNVLLLKSSKENATKGELQKMKRAIIFVKGNDTETQRAICEAYAKKHGFYVKGVVEKLSHAYDRSTEIDVLITAGLTRLGRYKRNYEEVIEMFDEAGVAVIIAE